MSFICKELAVELLRLKECMNCTHNMQLACKTCTVNECINAIKEIPAADVDKVKEGKWEEYDAMIGFYIVCSVCGAHFRTDHEGMTKYCPNCGAKMEASE